MGASRQAEGKSSQAFVAQVAAGTATREDPIFVAPVACKVTRVSVVPQAASAGNDTNRKNLNVLNKGAAGAGTTELGNLDLTATPAVNLVAFDESNIPFNSTYLLPGADLAEGDVLTLQTEQVGTGVAVGPFTVNVEWAPR